MFKTSVVLSVMTALITSILYFFSVPVHKDFPSTITYTALGDSIAEGVGATDNYGYTNFLADSLKAQYQTVNFNNAAKSGDTSVDLLSKLKISELKQLISSSDMVTICIGGNNILRGMDGVAAGNMDALNIGVSTSAKDWPQILESIRAFNNKSKIYVMTVYNPIGVGDSYGGKFQITPLYYEFIDSHIKQINSIISQTDTANKFNYAVVDVYTSFKEYSDKSKPLHGFQGHSDPHPTDAGHKLISELHIKALKQ